MVMDELKLPTKEVNVLRGHEGAVLAVRFNQDGNYCLSCGRDRTLRLWNPHRGLQIKTYKAHGRDVRDVNVSGDNAKLCSCGGDRQVFYWDVSTGRIIRKFRGHDSEVNSVKFNEPISVIVSGGYDRSIKTWDCRSHTVEPIQTIDTFSDSVTSVSVTSTEIIGGSVDGTVRTFDIRIGREIVDDLGQSVTSISLSNDKKCILAVSDSFLLSQPLKGPLEIYFRNTKVMCARPFSLETIFTKIAQFTTVKALLKKDIDIQLHHPLVQLQSYKMDSCLTNTDAHIVGGSEDGRVLFWDLVDGSIISTLKAHASVVTSVSYHRSDSCMITSSVDGTVRVWKS